MIFSARLSMTPTREYAFMAGVFCKLRGSFQARQRDAIEDLGGRRVAPCSRSELRTNWQSTKM
jgi:hypothetical protein